MNDIERPRSLSRITNCSSDAEYLDANEHVTYGDSLELLDTISETTITLNLFMNNKFDLAEERMEGLADRSMYHALGYNCIIFIKAMLTCDREALEKSRDVCNNATNVALRYRQKHSFTESIMSFAVKSTKHATDEELHAELVYAECLLFRAILSFFNDDNFASFIKGALNIRTCYRIYRTCEKIMNDESVWVDRDPKVRDQFEAGVRIGLGCFNLLISTLPSKVLRLLEVVGFSGDKAVGMSELHRCSSMTHTLHSPLATMILLTWHLVGCFVLGAGQPDIPLCHRLLPSMMAKYPKGSVTLFLRARLLLVSSDIDSAIYYFNKSVESQDLYKQFHHGCYWELLFAHSYLGQWSKAANFARRLMVENRWSRSIYTYMLAIFFAADRTVEERKREEAVMALAKKVDYYRLRIAGKSIPLEKFCGRKANRYIATKSLLYAHYEFIYFWSGYDILNGNARLVQPMIDDIEETWKYDCDKADINDRCLFQFLRAVLYRQLRNRVKAEECLQEVIRSAKKLTDFFYLFPYSLYELALLRIAEGHREEAEALLSEARKQKGYSLENKLHFRIHGAMEQFGARTPMM